MVATLERAIGAVVARFVHTEEVTGSNPVSPTRHIRLLTCAIVLAGGPDRMLRRRLVGDAGDPVHRAGLAAIQRVVGRGRGDRCVYLRGFGRSGPETPRRRWSRP